MKLARYLHFIPCKTNIQYFPQLIFADISNMKINRNMVARNTEYKCLLLVLQIILDELKSSKEAG